MPSTATAQELPLEIWFQILNQTLNLLLPIATTPRLYATYILPLLLTSHTFHQHCHPITYPHLRKNKLLQLFTRWKAAHSREVHFYHHPLRARVRYALPDRVGNPPGEEYETLYGFIKRSYLFGCESVCGTVIPVEGGLEVPVLVPSVPAAAAAAAAGVPPGQGGNQENINAAGAGGAATMTNNSTPASTTGTGANNAGNVVIAPPPAQATAPAVTYHGGDGGGQGWKNHALQWHVANPTFAAEGTIELYKDIVEEYRRIVCGSAAVRERNREIERAMDMAKNPHRYAAELLLSESAQQQQHHNPSQAGSSSEQIRELDEEEVEDAMDEVKEVEELEDDEEDEVADDEDEEELIEQNENELLSEIEAKGGLRRRDSGHGQSSSEMDIDDDVEYEEYPRAKRRGSEDEEMMSMDHSLQEQDQQDRVLAGFDPRRSRAAKRDPETMAMDYQLESSSRHRRGQRVRKIDRSSSSSESEQEKLILDMSLDKQPSQPMASLSPFHPLESRTLPPSSSSSGTNLMRSGSPALFAPLMTSSTRKTHENGAYGRSSRSSRTSLQRSNSSPGTVSSARIPSSRSRLGHSRSFDNSSSSSSSSNSAAPVPTPTQQLSTESPSSLASSSSPSLSEPSSSSTISTAPASTQLQQQTRSTGAEDLDFDLASACANTFASDLAYVLARVPGLGAHFHRFEQLAKLKLHVGWAKHAQSRGGNDVFVMSCSRLISLLAPLANTPLVSERGG